MSKEDKKDFMDMFDIKGSKNDGDHKDRSDDGDLYINFDEASSGISDMIKEEGSDEVVAEEEKLSKEQEVVEDKIVKAEKAEKEEAKKEDNELFDFDSLDSIPKQKKAKKEVKKEVKKEETFSVELAETDGPNNIEDSDYKPNLVNLIPVDDEISDIKEEKIEEVKASEEEVEDLNKDLNKKSEAINEVVKKKKGQWSLISPSDIFDDFYRSKAEAIDDFLIGGFLIPFDEWKKEISGYSVNLIESVYDPSYIISMMETIEKYKVRIEELLIISLEQFTILDRFIELLRGKLAQAHYEKPAIKQDGVCCDHMVDIELYYCRLKSFNKTADRILDNLNSGSNCLSRKLTVIGNDKNLERHEIPDKKNVEKKVKNEDTAFDDLPIGAKVKVETEPKSAREVSW